MAHRKKPGWAFWLTVSLILLPILYVASFGPACWIGVRSTFGQDAVIVVYKPLLWCAEQNPHLDRALRKYATIGTRGFSPGLSGWWGPMGG